MIYSFFLLTTLAIVCSPTLADDINEFETTPTKRTIHNGASIPLVGAGVGNLQHELIPQVLRSIMDHDKGVLLIDTGRASRNEKLIAETVEQLLPIAKIEGDDPIIHVVTKVWYTHLGYERTKLSVHESLAELSNYSGVNPIHVHVLLHWPRCNDEIPWMNCEEEESNLPQYVKDAGPPPHLDPQTAWKDSWRALEDMYTEQQSQNDGKVKLASIGVSNFDFNELNTAVFESRIKPHIIQGNVWQVIFDQYTMELVKKQNVFFQAYNVMNGIVGQKSKAPAAFSILTNISNSLTTRMAEQFKGREDELMPLTEAMIVSAWLLQQNIGIIPRASDGHHQWENAASTLQFVPIMDSSEQELVKISIEALLKGEDVTVEATFMNNVKSGPVHVHWIDKTTGQETPVIENLEPGEFQKIKTHPGHMFAIYDETKGERRQVDVKEFYGGHEVFPIDEF